MSNICNFDRILKPELQFPTFHQKLQNQEFGWLWKRWDRRVFAESRTFKCEGERNDHMLHYEQVFSGVFERRESKCHGVLMKHRHCLKTQSLILIIKWYERQREWLS